MAWRICEWNARFEPPKRGQSRKGIRRLDWVRMKVVGRHWGPGWRTLLRLCGQPGELTGYVSPFTVLGVFMKLVELAAEADVSCRDGTIYDDQGKPAEAAWIERTCGADGESLNAALPILSHPELAWIAELPPEESEVCAASFQSRRENGTQLKPTESNRDQLITDETKTKTKTKTKKERERETKRAREDPRWHNERSAKSDCNPANSGVLSRDSSFSDSLRQQQITLLKLIEIFPRTRTKKQAKSDVTTFRRIVEQLVHSETDATKVLEAARASHTGDKPVATFVDAAKRMGYQPRGREKHA